MLDLLRGIENILLFTLLAISASLVIVAVLTAIILSLRRLYRNQRDAKTVVRQKRFEAFIQKRLGDTDLAIDLDIPPDIRQDRTAIVTALLKFFKIVRGEDSSRLKILVEELHLEPIVLEATKIGNRGKRMRALTVLSFLHTRSSLMTIAEHLYSEDKYIRLSVARCLARRGVLSLLSEVSESVSTAFPKDEKIMADVLLRFGPDAVPLLESLVERSKSKTIAAGALEALILLRPANTKLDLSDMMFAKDARIRAATVDFSTVCEYDHSREILSMGLADESLKVKIRSLKIALREQRPETFSNLYKLMHDPHLWVRYWAMRASLKSGTSGMTLMRSISRRDGQLGKLAGEVLLERNS